MYIYPDNLKAKAKLWLWELRDGLKLRETIERSAR